MSLADYDVWSPEEWGGSVYAATYHASVVLSSGRHEPMTSDVLHTPRVGMMDINVTNAGSDYIENTAAADLVTLTARKLTRMISLAEEHRRDQAGYIQHITTQKNLWATSFGIAYDNASLGVSAAESATDTDNRPYTSVYKLVSTTATGLGYTAGDNLTQTGTGGTTYTTLNAAMRDYEESLYADSSSTVIIASPAYKAKLRGIVDDNHRPIFYESAGVDSMGRPQGSLFGYPILWTSGARVSAAMTKSPPGSPLMVITSRQALINGDSWGIESMVIPSAISIADVDRLKMRFRGGFAGAHPSAFSVHEDNS